MSRITSPVVPLDVPPSVTEPAVQTGRVKRRRDEEGGGVVAARPDGTPTGSISEPLKKRLKRLGRGFRSCMVCPICHQLFFECVSAWPCLHSYCACCIADWLAIYKSCPTCKIPINMKSIAVNHKLNGIVETVVEAYPDLETRTKEERDELHEKNPFRARVPVRPPQPQPPSPIAHRTSSSPGFSVRAPTTPRNVARDDVDVTPRRMTTLGSLRAWIANRLSFLRPWRP
jgi:hypothetical protein